MTAALHTPWWWSGSTISFVTAYVRAIEAGRTAWDLSTYLGAPSSADLRRAVLALRRQGHHLPTPQPPLPPTPELVPDPDPEWLITLRREVYATSQTKAAARLGYQNSCGIWRVLKGKASDGERRSIAARVQLIIIDGKSVDDLPKKPPRPEKTAKPGTTRRTCLKCRQSFQSWGAGNRLCAPCRSSNAYDAGYGGI